MAQAAAFFSAVLGDALTAELVLLVAFVLLVNVRRALLAAQEWQRSEE